MFIAYERLLQVLRYDSETGIFTWRVKPSNAIQIGDRAGSLAQIYDKKGRKTGKFRGRIAVDGRDYATSRLVWFYMTGEWPPNQIDHRDTDTLNDRWVNLRLADNSGNGANKAVRQDSSTGVKGVFAKSGRKSGYEARITVRGEKIYLGYARTLAEGAALYAAAAKKYFGEFARTHTP